MLLLARSLGLAVVLSALAAGASSAATLSPVGSFDQPIFVTSDPGDPDRLLVVERPGRVAVVEDEGAPRLFADLTGLVSCCAGERGLLSIAPAPDFSTSGLFYAAYTGLPAAGGSEGDIHVDAFVADAAGAVTRSPVISIPHDQSAHNGGQIQFGPDGYLYISTGDGGGAGDPFENGQSLSSLLGKILRIDPRPGSSPAYAIPPGNPFAGAEPGADEIWAYGLRNPWRFSFDRLTGDMLIGDVGQREHEEVDRAVSPAAGVVGGAGANYGWSCREGFFAYTDATPTANCAGVSGFTDPVFDYPHEDPGEGKAHGCSITGGYVARDPSLGDLYGRYLYADYCTGDVRSLAPPAGAAPAVDRDEGIKAPNPTSFGEDSCGRLYITSGSNVFRFAGASPAVCPWSPEEEPPEEEPPGEEPTEEEPPGRVPPGEEPPVGAPSAVAPAGQAQAPPEQPRYRVSIRSSARLRRTLVIEVLLRPCVPVADHWVQLNKGGKPVSTKPLGSDCRTHFRLRSIDAPATFRALARPSDEVAVRSKRLAIGPTPEDGQRSQVRKIALAKPIP